MNATSIPQSGTLRTLNLWRNSEEEYVFDGITPEGDELEEIIVNEILVDGITMTPDHPEAMLHHYDFEIESTAGDLWRILRLTPTARGREQHATCPHCEEANVMAVETQEMAATMLDDGSLVVTVHCGSCDEPYDVDLVVTNTRSPGE